MPHLRSQLDYVKNSSRWQDLQCHLKIFKSCHIQQAAGQLAVLYSEQVVILADAFFDALRLDTKYSLSIHFTVLEQYFKKNSDKLNSLYAFEPILVNGQALLLNKTFHGCHTVTIRVSEHLGPAFQAHHLFQCVHNCVKLQ